MYVSRNTQHKDVFRKTRKIKANYYFKVYNAHFRSVLSTE